jgi:ABC-2 type transport system permease protein
MKAILNITFNDLRIFFSERGNLVGLVALPLLFTLILGWTLGGGGQSGPTRLRVDVVDQDGTPQVATLLQEIREANSALVLCPMDNDEGDFCRLEGQPLSLERAIQRAQEGRVQGLMVIPAGYAQALLTFDQVQIDFYAAGDPNLPNGVEQTVLAVLQRQNTASLTAGVMGAILTDLGEQTGLGVLLAGFQDGYVQAVYTDAQRRMQQRPNPVRYVTSQGEADAPQIDQGFGQSVPGMGTMYVMFTVLGGMAALLRERRQWTLQRLTTLPVRRSQILGGKMLTYFILGMIQYAIVFGVGILVGLNLGAQPLALLPVMIAFTFCCTGMTFALAPFMTSAQQADGLTRLLALSLAPLGGAWWPLEIVPDFMRTVAYLSPVGWAMQSFHDIMWYNRGVMEILPNVGVLMAAGLVFFFVGVRRFKLGE